MRLAQRIWRVIFFLSLDCLAGSKRKFVWRVKVEVISRAMGRTFCCLRVQHVNQCRIMGESAVVAIKHKMSGVI